MVAWLKSRKRTKGEERTIELTVGDRNYEGPVASEEELQRILIAVIVALGLATLAKVKSRTDHSAVLLLGRRSTVMIPGSYTAIPVTHARH